MNATPDRRTVAKPKRPPPHATAAIAERRRAAAIELIEELVANGKKLIKHPDEHDQAAWRKVVDFAKRNQLLPPGTRLEKMRTRSGDLQIRLLDGHHPNTRNLVAGGQPEVPVPTQLRSLHPVVKAIQDDRGRLVMPGSLRQRCLLWFHGLTREAVRRDYTVSLPPIAPHHRGRIYTYGRKDRPDYSRREGELGIVVDGFTYTIEIDQQHPQAEDLESFDRLVVTVHPAYLSGSRQYRWADGKRQRIEHCLGAVLRELERRAADQRFEQAQRQIAWQAAMDQAKHVATEAHYAATLTEQLDAWRLAADLRRYCEALELRIRQTEQAGQMVDGSRRWLAWARQYADAIDPLQTLPAMPVLQLRPSDLQPFLDGWSVNGPEERWPSWRR